MSAPNAQVCGADLHADPEQLRARLRGRGLWGWFQFETSALRPHRDELTGLLALDEALGEALGEALDEALDYVMGADATLGGGGGCLRHEDSSCDSGRRGASSTATGDAASGVSTATEGADHDSGEALSSSNDHARAAATSRPLRDSPPFEIDGQQGGAWTDKSGVDFRVPLDWYGDALRALPLDSGRDVLWVCSDDRELALSGQVCGFRATSWPAAAAAAMEAAAAAAAGATVTKPGEAAVGEAPRQAPPGRATMRAAPWIQLVREHAVIADWFVMQRADVLLISNSTFSFTAAMLSQPRGSSHGPCAAGATATTSSGHSQALLRPDPTLAAFRPFDPWGELPLLPSAPVSSNHSVRQQHQKRQQQQKL
ncbi:hypothetical protein HYH02_000439 [Chlamydomonas schloesseri]|uniref:Fucosyltransferase n=1 Tax=Chlamydomonas schloesseri TaxID=2026947 RepID=A0A836BCV0_9CHLO|nr:hypothetical protein HYH02_000439 [Chlamydomonas schloesseri]|eukprot:KAG2454598.1 hypothetical protein HYH02_000439 [Chlamydomonas schloesseri]